MAKILIINPTIREEEEPRHIPYGLALIAAIAIKYGHLVQVFDANAHRPTDNDLQGALKADEWDVVASGGITTTYAYVKKAMKFAGKYAPRALKVVGGGLLTSMPQDIMKFIPTIDLGVVGEGFITWPEILEKIDKRENDWKNVPGVIYREEDDTTKLSPARTLVQDLDSVVPNPAWELFPLDIYFKNSATLLSEISFQSKRRLDINASYGCSLICRFCYHLGISGDLQYVQDEKGEKEVRFTYDRIIRYHSPRYIIDLVKYAHKNFGIDFIAFLDENLMTMDQYSKRTWLKEICRLWIEEGLQPQCVRDGEPHDPHKCKGVHWGGTSHAQLATPEILNIMANAGCTYLDYGLETFSPRILKSMGKGTSARANAEIIDITLDAGIRPIPNQIIGFPDEWFDSIKDSMKAWEKLGIQARPFLATPYPGSEWYSKYKEKILEQYDGDLEAFILDLGDATRPTATISENFTAVELLGLREVMMDNNYRLLELYEKQWREAKGEPIFPDVKWAPAQRIYKREKKKPVEEAED